MSRNDFNTPRINRPEAFGGGLSKQKGAGKLTILVFGTMAFVVLYVAYHVLPFYYYYYEIQNQFESHAKAAATYTNQEIQRKLMYHIKKMELPINGPQDLKIDRNSDTITISMSYSELFYISWGGKDYDIHRFEFHPKATASIK